MVKISKSDKIWKLRRSCCGREQEGDRGIDKMMEMERLKGTKVKVNLVNSQGIKSLIAVGV